MRAWPLVPLGEVLLPISRPEPLIATEQYRLLGAHWYAEGLYIKDIKTGSEIQANQLYRVEAGDFVYNRLFAWKGSFALAGKDVHGCYVSNEFPCFRLREERADGRYLHYYFSRESIWNEALGLSSGGTPTSRNRLKEDRLLAMAVPLPPIEEQRRVVQRIDLLTRKVQTVHKLQAEITTELDSLIRSVTSDLFASASKRFGVVKLSGLIADSGYGTSVKCSVEREDGSVPVLRIPNVAAGAISFSDLKFGVLSDRELDGVSLQSADVLLVRTNGSLSLVGRCAVVEELPEPTAFASYLIRLRCDKKQVLPPFLQSALNYLRESRWLIEFARTTAGQYNVSLGRLHEAEIPLPPLEEQERIVRRLGNIIAQMRPCYSMRRQLEKESNVVTASVLNQAFSGQL
jgi:type I restriction enzyme S subunit